MQYFTLTQLVRYVEKRVGIMWVGFTPPADVIPDLAYGFIAVVAVSYCSPVTLRIKYALTHQAQVLS